LSAGNRFPCDKVRHNRGAYKVKLAQRAFTQADQEQFAGASGDRNPMHMDALRARRTQSGAPVVHGVNLLLWALDSLAADHATLPALRALRVQFNKFVYLNEPVEVIVVRQDESCARLTLSVEGAARAKIAIDFGERVPASSALSNARLGFLPISAAALEQTLEQLKGLSGALPFCLTPSHAAKLYPAAQKWIGLRRLAFLTATTYLVGMVCPGLHSIYSELSLEATAERAAPDQLTFCVAEVDERFRSVEHEVCGGGFMGSIKSFLRTPPVEQASMRSLEGVVDGAEFSSSVALIVGGSRGLGELTAKLIATGGGRVIITYQAGKEDAERVAQEICSAGAACDTLHYDALKPAQEQLIPLLDVPTHAYYFATPAIFRPQSEMFSSTRFAEYQAFYVDAFWRLSQALRARQSRISLFYPSSISVSERPRGMTEYTMAKAAGEVLCADINAFLSPTHVTVSRLPRLPTDQTASITSVEMASPLETMRPIVREVHSWPR
jgi:acyl dehydratase